MTREIVPMTHHPLSDQYDDDPKKPLRFGLWVIVLLLGSFGGWSLLTQINGAVIAPGTVTVESSRKTVQHPDGGIVSEILVRAGDQVEAGQVLARLDGTLDGADLQAIVNQLDEFLARRARLYAETTGAHQITFPAEFASRQSETGLRDTLSRQQALFVAQGQARDGQADLLRQRILRFEQEIDGLEAQRAAEERQLELLDKELAGLRELHKKGYARLTRILALERAQAEVASTIAGRNAQIARAQNGIEEVRLQMIQNDRDARESLVKELEDVESRIAVLAERKVAADARYKRVDIRAPHAGTVLGLNIKTVGGVVRPGETILEIVPQDDDLVVEARVAVDDIELVTTGSSSTIRLSALDGSASPEIDGQVTWVSADSITDQRTGATHYLARVQIDSEASKPDLMLVPGMPAEVFIKTGGRSPISYLLKPLTDNLARSFREG